MVTTAENPQTVLRLYVAGRSPRSERAIEKVRALTAEHPDKGYSVEIRDALERPDLAELDHIVATPTLVRLFPKPEIRIVGDLVSTSDLAGYLETAMPCAAGNGDYDA